MADPTPGPWTKLPRNIIRAHDGQNSICSLSQWAPDDSADSEQDANADLISAAPDMLEALESWFKCLTPTQEQDWRDMHLFNSADALKKCKAAVAKARGVEPEKTVLPPSPPENQILRGKIIFVKQQGVDKPYATLIFSPERKDIKDISIPLRLTWLWPEKALEHQLLTSVSSIAIWLHAADVQEPAYGWVGITGCSNSNGDWVYQPAEEVVRYLKSKLEGTELSVGIRHIAGQRPGMWFTMYAPYAPKY